MITNPVTTGPTLSELLTLMPPVDIPDDARLAVTAGDLRAMLSRLKVSSDAIGEALEILQATPDPGAK